MKAIDLIIPNINKNYQYVETLQQSILTKLKQYPNVSINSTQYSIPYTINISLKNIKPETFIHAMDEYDIYISTKSACSNTNTMSDSVYAVTKDREKATRSIRISLSYLTTTSEIEEFLKVFDICYNKLNLKG